MTEVGPLADRHGPAGLRDPECRGGDVSSTPRMECSEAFGTVSRISSGFSQGSSPVTWAESRGSQDLPARGCAHLG